MCNDHIDEQCHIALSYNIYSNTGIPSVTQQHQTPLPISLDINQRTPTACADLEKCAFIYLYMSPYPTIALLQPPNATTFLL